MISRCELLLMSGFFAIVLAPVSGAQPFDKSVVEITATCQTADPTMPWRRNPPTIKTGFGVVVAPGEVLTTEELVRQQVMVEFSKARQGDKVPAHVVQADPQTGLALLTYAVRPERMDLVPLAISTAIASTGDVSVLQFDQTGEMQSDAGRIVGFSLEPLPDSPTLVLQQRILVSLNTGARGAPVIFHGTLGGMIVRSDPSRQTCYGIPGPLLARFLEGARSSVYAGCASAGFTWQSLVDPIRLHYLGLKKNAQGIEVVNTLPGSGADGLLESSDVILALDDNILDSQGYYADTHYGRVLFPFIIGGKHQPGDVISARLWRQHAETNVQIRLTRRVDEESFIPDNLTQLQPEYLLESGLIFRELGGDYLRAFGSKWALQANPRLVHLFLTRAQQRCLPHEHIVILAGVLPDKINIGYQQFRDGVVTAVNGETIYNLDDVFRIVDRDKGLHRVSLLSVAQDIVLNPDEREAAHQRITAQYRIPSLRYRHRHPSTP